MSTKSISTNEPRTTMKYTRNTEGHFVCPECGIVKARQNSMHYHMKKHMEERSHLCVICNKGFLQKQTLELHLRSKHPERARQLTPKSSSSSSESDSSSSSSEEGKPYHCPFDHCDFKALTKGNCIIHCLRVHFQDEIRRVLRQEDKTFHCGQCNRNFQSASSFYYHCKACLIQHPHPGNADEKYRRLQSVM
jgi:hypothetical protein